MNREDDIFELEEDILSISVDQQEAPEEQEAFFPEAVRNQRLNLLLHLVPRGGIFLVTGEEKSGKTFLMEQFFAECSEQTRLCSLDADADTDSSELLRMIMAGFELQGAGQDEEEGLKLFVEQLRAWKNAGEYPVLVIDDAHFLQDETFFLLLKLLHNPYAEERALSIILFARPELERRLAKPDMRLFYSRITHSFDLPPFSDDDATAYIRFRLEQMQETKLPSSMMKFVRVASRGVPGKMDELLATVLRSRRDGRSLIQDGRVSTAEEPSDDGAASAGRRKKSRWPYALTALFLAGSGIWLAKPELDALMKTVPGLASIERLLPREHLPEEEPASVVMADVVVPAGGQSGAAEGQETSRLVSDGAAPRGGGRQGTMAEIDVPAMAGQQSVLADTEDLRQPDKPVAVASAGPLADDGRRAAGTVAAKAAKGGVRGKSARSVERVISLEERILNDEQWLSSRRDSSYTLQLMAMKPSAAVAFVSRYGLGDQVRYYRTRGEKESLLAVTYGEYASLGDARMAERSLDKKLQGVRPWVRGMRTIKRAIVRAGGGATARQTSVKEEAEQQIAGGLSEHEQWLMEQAPRHYTLQLLAMDEAAVERFIRRNRLEGKVRTFRLVSKGRSLVAAVSGSYASKAEADRAAGQLASRISGTRPWVRSFASVQGVIEASPSVAQEQ